MFFLFFFYFNSLGRGMVSLHAHNGPVKFLTMATAVRNWSSSLPSSTPSSSLQQIESVDADSTQPVSDTASSPPQGRGVWLGEAGCTTMALQDSLSSSSCGSLAPSQVSLEHGPEDGALYDLLHDPAHHQRGRHSSKMDVSSLLVVSGGLGHRRVNKKTKQSRHEDNTSTIMIWQIPLLNMWHQNPNDVSLNTWKLHKIFLIFSFYVFVLFHVEPNYLHKVLQWCLLTFHQVFWINHTNLMAYFIPKCVPSAILPRYFSLVNGFLVKSLNHLCKQLLQMGQKIYCASQQYVYPWNFFHMLPLKNHTLQCI